MSDYIKYIIKSAYTDLILDGILDKNNKYSVRVKKDLNTACWSFNNMCHNIFIGDAILDNISSKKRDSKINHYIESYLYHEVGHSLFTERDLKALNECLHHKEMSFRMHNLFEDARIEHLIREKTKRSFKWLTYEDVNKIDTTQPISQFFLLIQKEFSLLNEDGVKDCFEMHNIDERILGFYKQTIASKDSWEVIDVMEEWLKVFPQSKEETEEQLGELGFGNNSDLSQSLQLQDNSQRLEEMFQDSDDVNENSSENSNQEGDKGNSAFKPLNHGKPLEEFSNYDYTRTCSSVDIDKTLIRRLLPKLQSIFRGKSVKTDTARPSKRLSIKGLINDSDKIYRREEEFAPSTKKFNLIVDCSGSMYGEPLNGAASITLLFSELAASRYVKGNLILSSTSGYQTFPLESLNQKRIEEVFHTHGGEGFSNTFDATEHLMRQAEINFVITDGYITDGALDKKKMSAKGIKTFGLYIGEPEQCELQKWFHIGAAKRTLTEMVDELYRKIRF